LNTGSAVHDAGLRDDASADDSHALRYLALGDSYTIGHDVSELARWPEQLVQKLRADGIDIAPPRIIATTGWTTTHLADAMDAAEPLGAWDFVTLLIGVNDQYDRDDVAVYRERFVALLQRAIALAGGRAHRVLVVSIPDWGVTPFAQQAPHDAAVIATEIDAYNAAANDVCEGMDVAFVDITPHSRAHGAEAAMLVDDGLHPSALMYTAWADAVHPVARDLLTCP